MLRPFVKIWITIINRHELRYLLFKLLRWVSSWSKVAYCLSPVHEDSWYFQHLRCSSQHHWLLYVSSHSFVCVFVVWTHIWLIGYLVRTSINFANLVSFQAKEFVDRTVPNTFRHRRSNCRNSHAQFPRSTLGTPGTITPDLAICICRLVPEQ